MIAPRALAWFVFLASVPIAGVAMWAYLNPVAPDPATTPGGQAVVVSVMVLFGLVGLIIVNRLPTNRIGWLLLMFSAVGVTGMLAQGGYGAGWWSESNYLAVQSYSDVVVPLLIAFTFLLFPNGSLPSPRWRWAAWGVTAVAGFGLVTAVIGLDGLQDARDGLAVASIIVGLAATIVRWRGSRGLERQQLRLVGWAAGILILVLLLSGLQELIDSRALVVAGNWLFVFAIAGLALSIGAAILRYRLYDIDRIFSRTVVYAIVVGLLLAVYGAGVVVLQTILPQRGDLAVAASTLVAAALFNPVRRRVQLFVDRRFYRSRYDAELVVEEFSARLRDEVDLEELTTDWVGVVQETVQPSSVSVWVRQA